MMVNWIEANWGGDWTEKSNLEAALTQNAYTTQQPTPLEIQSMIQEIWHSWTRSGLVFERQVVREQTTLVEHPMFVEEYGQLVETVIFVEEVVARWTDTEVRVNPDNIEEITLWDNRE
jgi:hypothetical protein